MTDETSSILSQVKFWLLLILSLPAIVCSILIFVYFFKKRKRLSIHLHVILLLVVISFLQITTDNPFGIAYYYRGSVAVASNIFCLWWNWWDYSTSSMLIMTMACGSVERHILIFHTSLMSSRRKRMIYHVFPMLVASLYPVIFYFAVIIVNTCKNEWDYQMLLCIQPCYLVDQPTIAIYDFLANIVFPVAIITSANAYLVVRIVRQRRARNQTSWSRQRKLALQLLYVAVIFIIFWIPLTLNGLVLTFTSSDVALDLQANYFFFFVYMVPILIPFVSLSYLPHFCRRLFGRRQRCIAPSAHFT